MAINEQEVKVYIDNGNAPAQLGTLYASSVRGKETYSFSYGDSWRTESNGVVLDPDLPYYAGRIFAPQGKPFFGLFSDSCPDRWGRTLMNRREMIRAKTEGRKPKRLSELDYLLGVYDESRMGALRVCLEDNVFLSDDDELATPPWITLRTLENAAIAFEQDDSTESERWLRQLVAPGSSLGGARPKATVQDTEGNLWIAKFPSKHDEFDSGLWEMVVHDLAGLCGLDVPEAKLERFSKHGSTFLVKRFDREGKRRIHFASAMTMLGKVDGEFASYLDIVSFLKESGKNPKRDLEELWRRIAFSISVSNTDDHLRNHGFLLAGNGWRLSPMYDVNPSVYGDALSLGIDTADNTMDYDLLISTAKYYGLSKTKAQEYIHGICSTVRDNWVKIAKTYGATRGAVETMKFAFSLDTPSFL